MIIVEYATYMRPVTPDNSAETYLLLGKVTNMRHTDALIDAGGFGKRYLYCKRHNHVYLPSEQCPHCAMERLP